MPEGDVVWYTARRLHGVLAGRTLTRSDFRVPRFATATLTGQTVTEAVSRGKHLRAGQPCRRCGTPIRRGEQGAAGEERARFWCPACQS